MKVNNLTIKSNKKYNYNATADYIDGLVIVKKGSIINSKVAESATYKQSKQMCNIRNNENYVSNDFVVLKDIQFKSASSAAEFVCGYSINGMVRWKKEKKPLIEILGGKNG